MNKPDWSEPLIRAEKALKAAQDSLAANDHVNGRKHLWEVLRAINEASNASLDIAPAK